MDGSSGPAGICVPKGDVSFVPPFAVEKVDDVNDYDCISPRDGQITYTITYDYMWDGTSGLEPGDFDSIMIYDHLAAGVDFVSAIPSGTEADGTVIWSIDPNFWDPNSVELVVQVNRKVTPGGEVENFVEIEAILGQREYVYDDIIETPVCDCDGYGEVIYVDVNAPDPCDGSSWSKAFKYLQDALDVAWPCDQVWVANGTYKPTTDPYDTDATFQMVSGVGLYGGFEGAPKEETKRYERNWFVNETILCGDPNGDDDYSKPFNERNTGDNINYVASYSSYVHVGVLGGTGWFQDKGRPLCRSVL